MDPKKINRVIKGLDCCTEYVVDCEHCPFKNTKNIDCATKLCTEALDVIRALTEKKKNKEGLKDEM